MVKLDLRSPYNPKQYPFLQKWDSEYRENHAFYQHEIDKITYQLQRVQRGFGPFGSWLYPNFLQRDFLLLDLYKKKQLVGNVHKEEVETFKAINPNISSDLDKTFSAKWYIPMIGGATGAGLNVFAHFFNYQYSFRLGLFLVPVLADYMIRYMDTSAYTNSAEFLNWLVEYRTARARIEFDSHQFQDKQGQIFQRFKHLTKVSKPVTDVYDDLIRLVASQPAEHV